LFGIVDRGDLDTSRGRHATGPGYPCTNAAAGQFQHRKWVPRTFAAVNPRNNRKLGKDLDKLTGRDERHRDVDV
jgi:hypothetical protein